MKFINAANQKPKNTGFILWREIDCKNSGNSYSKTNGFIDAFGLHHHDYENIEWLDETESAPAAALATDKNIEEVIAAFVKVARHARNFPHPKIPLGLLKTEAVDAERLAESVLGVEVYNRINDIAFNA